MKNIVVLVSGGGTNLQVLIDSIENKKITNAKIQCVISSKTDAYAVKRAEKHNIPYVIIERKGKTREEFSDMLLEEIVRQEADLIIMAGFLCITSAAFVGTFKNKIINIHPSLIPSFCGDSYFGIRVHEAALEKGVKIVGATVHFVNEITDGGPIILQKAVEVLEGDTPEILQKRVMEQAEWSILPEAVNLFCNGKLEVKNNKVLIKE